MVMTFDDFKAKLVARFGERGVRFHEHGANGWTSVESILDGRPKSEPGPHWCDVSYIPATQRLAASYDFTTSTARFFCEL